MFSKTVTTALDINATSNKIWEVIGKLEHYSQWNQSTQFNSPATPGKLQLMKVKLGALWLPVPVLIRHCDARQGLCWTGGIPGLITGSHYFRIEAVDENRSKLVQGEDFTGLLVPLLLPLLADILGNLYANINIDTKKRCEQ